MNLRHSEMLVVNHFKEHLETAARSLEGLREQIVVTSGLLIEALSSGKKVIAFGNGGSATQASHLVGELVGRFCDTRRPLPAIALAADSGVVTCIGNDFGYATLFERQIEAHAQAGDVAIGFTTSGRSKNVRRGLCMAAQKGAVTVALTGVGGLDGGDAQQVLRVPSTSTACIQEIHLTILHLWCFSIDAALGNAFQEELSDPKRC